MAGPYSAILGDAADREGLDADYLDRIMRIESGGKPTARTGSYRGLFQMGPDEWRRYGGGRNIYDPVANTNAAAAMMADQRRAFTQKYGRPPDPTETYMIHQQGSGGLDAHLANPDAPAWQNMLSTGEGRRNGANWARRAIWGNVPDDLKGRYGNVNNITSAQFINDVWRPKVEGTGAGAGEGPPTGSPAGPPVQADPQQQTSGGSPAGLPMQPEDVAGGVSYRTPSGQGIYEDYRTPGLANRTLATAADNNADRTALGGTPSLATSQSMAQAMLAASSQEKDQKEWDQLFAKLKMPGGTPSLLNTVF